jgi:ATP-dependent RNA helicase DeaD
VAAPVERAPKPTSTYIEPVMDQEAPAPAPAAAKPKKEKGRYERKPRTGREPGYTPVELNVGTKHLITPGDVVGKIAGVTRLPANIVGAIDIHEAHTHVDVLSEHAPLVIQKLAGIRLKDQALTVALVPRE